MTQTEPTGRTNQRRRTRKDLLQAAARLVRQGKNPSLEEIAAEAMVSRATAYRYFQSAEEVLVESALDIAVVSPEALFEGTTTDDPVARMERVDDMLSEVVGDNNLAIRLMLSHALAQSVKPDADKGTPVRQNRRMPLIETALAPANRDFKPADLDILKAALALIVGTESMLVFRDVLQVDDEKARKVRRWMIRTLVEAAKKPAARG